MLRKLGWVYRDVSIGNILSYNGQAKLADLEYAKKMGDSKGRETRTASEYPITLSGKSLIASQQGTKNFMSIEVAAQEFLFPPDSELSLAELDDEFSITGRSVRMAQTEVPFSHNHLHDLGSQSGWSSTTIFQKRRRLVIIPPPHFETRRTTLSWPKFFSLPLNSFFLAAITSIFPSRSSTH